MDESSCRPYITVMSDQTDASHPDAGQPDAGQTAETSPPSDKATTPEQPQAAPAQAEASPADTFKQGMGLLWKAARSTVDEIKTEVNRGGVADSLKQAGRELEDAANQAATALESFLERMAPQARPPAQQGRPADTAPPTANPDTGNTAAKPPAAPAEDTAVGADDGDDTRDGEMRIKIDE